MRKTFTSGSVGRAPGNRCSYPDRAKVNPKPWNWEQSHEMGCCYPVGASRGDSSPTRLTPSPQVGRELHVQAQQWEYEAGGNEATGCVIEPRKRLLWWSTGYPSEEIEGKADGVEKPEGSSPGHVMASVWDTTGVEERGMYPEG